MSINKSSSRQHISICKISRISRSFDSRLKNVYFESITRTINLFFCSLLYRKYSCFISFADVNILCLGHSCQSRFTGWLLEHKIPWCKTCRLCITDKMFINCIIFYVKLGVVLAQAIFWISYHIPRTRTSRNLSFKMFWMSALCW